MAKDYIFKADDLHESGVQWATELANAERAKQDLDPLTDDEYFQSEAARWAKSYASQESDEKVKATVEIREKLPKEKRESLDSTAKAVEKASPEQLAKLKEWIAATAADVKVAEPLDEAKK